MSGLLTGYLSDDCQNPMSPLATITDPSSCISERPCAVILAVLYTLYKGSPDGSITLDPVMT